MSNRQNRSRGRKPHDTARPAATATDWSEWQDERRREMVRDGVSRRLAAQVAELETVGRRRIGQLIGDTAAMNAELIAEDVPGGSRFHLVVPMGDVPPEQSSSITSILVGLGVGYPA